MPPPITASVVYGAASGTQLGNIPQQVVPSTIVSPQVQNNKQGVAIPTYGNTGAVATFTAPPNYLALSSPGATPNYSVAFFAQLLAQSSPADQSLLTRTFPNPVPFNISQPETMESFAAIKFLPSNAAKPLPPKADIINSDIQAVTPQRVYTRNYQAAQRLQSDGEQIRVDMSRLGGVLQARQSAATGVGATSAAPVAAAVVSSAVQRNTGSNTANTSSRVDASANNLVYRAPNVSYGKAASGASAYLNTLSLFNPPPISPVLKVL